MKNLHFALLVLTTCATTLVNGLFYHPYEELGRHRQGDLLIKTVPGPNGFRDSMNRWSESTVPYVFGAELSTSQRQLIQAAMNTIENVSCVRFVAKAATHESYVNITGQQSGCWAALGKQDGVQQLNLDPRGCMATGIILHQLMHTLGFTHPTSRSDRDLYVRVELGNVNSWERDNFEKFATGQDDDFGMTYDYESIMHRSALAFSNNGRPTVQPLHTDIELGQRNSLSFKDVRKLNQMYPCTGW